MIDLRAAPTLAEDAYDRVEELIVTLELEPGAVFSEGDLAKVLDIGRTPLREALQRLAGDGLVASIPRKGMRVAPLDLTEILAVIETRKSLDRLVVGGAAKRATGTARTRIRERLDALSMHGEGGGARDFMKADYELDKAVWEASPNQYAVRATRPLHSHCRRFWFRHRDDTDLHRSADLHLGVMEAILLGDPAAAVERSDKLLDYLTLFTKHILIAG